MTGRSFVHRIAIAFAIGAMVVGAAMAAGGFAWARGPAPAAAHPEGRRQQFWPDGGLKSDVTYRDDAYEGEYRTWYATGRPFELRHYVDGHESGLQQSWTESGELYLNYEVRDGRRFGLVNATPCNEVRDRAPAAGSVAGGRMTRSAEAPQSASAHLTSTGSDGRITSRLSAAQGDVTDASGLPYYEEETLSPQWAPVSHRVAAFSVRTQDGSLLSDSSLRGRPYVASFIYTQCAAVCPILVRHLSRVQDAVRGGRVRIVSFSVTPETDTPAVLAAFGRERGIDPSVWSLATGSRRTIYGLARTSFFADDSRVGSGPEDETAFLHTEKLLLVDADGHLRGVYNGTQPHAIDQLMTDLGRLSGQR